MSSVCCGEAGTRRRCTACARPTQNSFSERVRFASASKRWQTHMQETTSLRRLSTLSDRDRGRLRWLYIGRSLRFKNERGDRGLFDRLSCGPRLRCRLLAVRGRRSVAETGTPSCAFPHSRVGGPAARERVSTPLGCFGPVRLVLPGRQVGRLSRGRLHRISSQARTVAHQTGSQHTAPRPPPLATLSRRRRLSAVSDRADF